MSDDVQLILLTYLNKRYTSLRQRLSRMLGNDDLAGDALHDTWLRLNTKDDYGPIANPGSYLFRMTVNTAMNIHRRQQRLLSGEEADLLLEEMADPAAGPARIAEGRSDMAALMKIIEGMPQRRRQIVVLVHWEEITQVQVAECLGVSLRTVQYELKIAQEELSACVYAVQAKKT